MRISHFRYNQISFINKKINILYLNDDKTYRTCL